MKMENYIHKDSFDMFREQQARMFEDLTEEVRDIKRILSQGNGKPSLMERVRVLELTKEQQEKTKIVSTRERLVIVGAGVGAGLSFVGNLILLLHAP